MKGWLRPKGGAEYADVSERTLRTWLKEEALRSSRVRGTILIRVNWIDEFLEQHEVSGKNELEGIVDEVMRGLE